MKVIFIILLVVAVMSLIPCPCHAAGEHYYYCPLPRWYVEWLISWHLEGMKDTNAPVLFPLQMRFETTMPNGDVYTWSETINGW